MHIAVNAIPLRPGGGLTVILGLLRGLRGESPEARLTVFAHHEPTVRALQDSGDADSVRVVRPVASNVGLFIWQEHIFGSVLRSARADALVTVNHYLRNIPCPQVVYHLNLLRFSRDNSTGGARSRVTDWFRNKAAERALFRAEANVFESHYLKDRAVACYPGAGARNSVAYIGLPDAVVEESTQSDDGYRGQPRILAVTSPYPHKDNETLIRMLAALRAQAPNVPWRLDIAGGSSEKDWDPLRRLASELGVTSSVSWLGFCDHRRLDALLRQSLCLVSTSLVESFAMVAIEAMARRCPAIVADSAAMPESVGDAGLLARPSDAASFAEAVRGLYETPGRREQVVQRGLEWIEPLRWSRCGRDFWELFRNLAPAG